MLPQHYSRCLQNMPNSFMQLALRSIRLDYRFLLSPVPVKKLEFVWKKSLFLLFSPCFWDNSVQAYCVYVWNRRIYLENLEHIGLIQLTFLHHQYFYARNISAKTVIDVGAHTGEFALF